MQTTTPIQIPRPRNPHPEFRGYAAVFDSARPRPSWANWLGSRRASSLGLSPVAQTVYLRFGAEGQRGATVIRLASAPEIFHVTIDEDRSNLPKLGRPYLVYPEEVVDLLDALHYAVGDFAGRDASELLDDICRTLGLQNWIRDADDGLVSQAPTQPATITGELREAESLGKVMSWAPPLASYNTDCPADTIAHEAVATLDEDDLRLACRALLDSSPLCRQGVAESAGVNVANVTAVLNGIAPDGELTGRIWHSARYYLAGTLAERINEERNLLDDYTSEFDEHEQDLIAMAVNYAQDHEDTPAVVAVDQFLDMLEGSWRLEQVWDHLHITNPDAARRIEADTSASVDMILRSYLIRYVQLDQVWERDEADIDDRLRLGQLCAHGIQGVYNFAGEVAARWRDLHAEQIGDYIAAMLTPAQRVELLGNTPYEDDCWGVAARLAEEVQRQRARP